MVFPIQTIVIYPNPARDEGLAVTRRLLSLVIAHGLAPVLAAAHRPQLADFPQIRFEENPFVAEAEAVFVLGGDGTLLGAVQAMAERYLPLIGINLGRVGFLTEVEPGDLETAVTRWLAGDYHVDRRAMLQVSAGGGTWHALNDAVVTRGAVPRMITLEISVNCQPLWRLGADGLIAATPTGSTAYALAAGGPVVAPHMRGTLLVPTCAHALYARPVLVPDNEPIVVRCLSGDASLCIDGVHRLALHCDDVVEITRSAHEVSFVRFGQEAFYARVRAKLGG